MELGNWSLLIENTLYFETINGLNSIVAINYTK